MVTRVMVMVVMTMIVGTLEIDYIVVMVKIWMTENRCIKLHCKS